MRRKEREVTDLNKIREVMESCTCLHLGLNDNGRVYIVPLNFGYAFEDGQFTLYFHGALEGRKVDVIRANPVVGFEMECGYALRTDLTACGHTASFCSIIGEGTVTILTDREEKRIALNQVMLHNTGKRAWDFPEMMLEKTNVFKLCVEHLSCKIHE